MGLAEIRDSRHAAVLAGAIEATRKYGYRNFTRDSVARFANVANGTVNHAFGTMAALRDAVMREAIEKEMLDIIAQGLADGHEMARNAPPKLRQKAAYALA